METRGMMFGSFGESRVGAIISAASLRCWVGYAAHRGGQAAISIFSGPPGVVSGRWSRRCCCRAIRARMVCSGQWISARLHRWQRSDRGAALLT